MSHVFIRVFKSSYLFLKIQFNFTFERCRHIKSWTLAFYYSSFVNTNLKVKSHSCHPLHHTIQPAGHCEKLQLFYPNGLHTVSDSKHFFNREIKSDPSAVTSKELFFISKAEQRYSTNVAHASMLTWSKSCKKHEWRITKGQEGCTFPTIVPWVTSQMDLEFLLEGHWY